MVTKQGQAPTYYGESTDTKPKGALVNSHFEELDTGDKYYYTGESWEKIGGTD